MTTNLPPRGRCQSLALAIVFLLGMLAAPLAQAQYTLLHSFTGGTDGITPFLGRLLMDEVGNLFGTTLNGGPANAGVIYKIDPSGHETILYRFSGPDGAFPASSLVRDAAGNLYGTTNGAFGRGTIFKLNPSGNETVLHHFAGGSDGSNPEGNLLRDAVGNLYGVTNSGGSFNYGTVFKFDPSGQETVLHHFTNSGGDGAFPVAGLSMDATGNLYGTTAYGGSSSDWGMVYKLDPSGNETILHTFTNLSGDGARPFSGVIIDAAGIIYGTTSYGGSGSGTVYKLDSSGTFTVLHTFTYYDGSGPFSGLIRDAAGNLYGTNRNGSAPPNYSNSGNVFKLAPSGILTVLHAFTGANGANPYSDLIMDVIGNLYGTTAYGGSLNYGTVFRISQSPALTQAIVDSVQALVTQGSLNRGQGNALIAKLEAAIKSLNSGNTNAARGELGAFINQVNALLNSGQLTSLQAQALVAAANAVLASFPI